MNRGTMTMAVLAALSVGGAVAMRPEELPPPTFEDVGLALFPEFTDPSAAASLEVKTWDNEAAKLVSFKVQLKDGVWVIPSHNDYPADATERMGKAAASFIGILKDVVRSDLESDHAEFGVQDPEDAAAKAGGKGQRITMTDESGNTLVDIIVGKDVPDREGFKFVRFPEQDRTYAARLELDISTNFTDWIEEDLLKLERDSVVEVVSNSYHVDEATGRVVENRPLRFTRQVAVTGGEEGGDGEGKAPEWALADDVRPPAGKELNETKVKQTFGAMARTKIVGVRPQPRPLTDVALQAHGFFLGGDPQNPVLFGNEGELTVVCNDGVVYTVYFGEVTYHTGLALTAGGADAEKVEGDEANRFMWVRARYDASKDTGAWPVAEGNEPEEGALRGEERAKALAARFNRWFYVIPGHSYTQMHKTWDDFWKDVKEPKKD
jgi:hypothetical protein